MRIPKKLQTVGREGLFKVDGVEVSVIILDARLHIEAVDYFIEPTAGKGQMWVSSELVNIPEDQSVVPVPKK